MLGVNMLGDGLLMTSLLSVIVVVDVVEDGVVEVSVVNLLKLFQFNYLIKQFLLKYEFMSQSI